jgi:hypothetical protein
MTTTGKKWAKRLLALVLGIALAEGTLGVAARLSPKVKYHLDQPWARVLVPDEVLGFRMSPFYPGNDAWGFRNKAVPKTCELLTVGDSVTYGFAAPGAKAWPRQLEEKTGKSVYNISCGGYGPCEYRVLLDKGLTLQPKTVLLGMHSGVGGDFLDAYISVYNGERFPEYRSKDKTLLARMKQADQQQRFARGVPALSLKAPGSFRAWLSRHSNLYALGRELYPIVAGKQFTSIVEEENKSNIAAYEAAAHRPWSLPFKGDKGFRTVFRKPQFLVSGEIVVDARFREGKNITHQILLGFEKKLAEQSIGFAVVIVPSRELVYKDLIASNTQLAPLLPAIACEERITGDFESFLRSNRIAYVNTTGGLRAGVNRDIHVFPETDDVHPNANGYTIIADAVAEFLTKASF